MNRNSRLGLVVLMILLVALPAAAQNWKSRAEYDAYIAFFNERNPQKKAELGEKFLTDYKDSEAKPQSFQLLTGAYRDAQNWAKVIDIAGRLETELPAAAANIKSFVLSTAMGAAQQQGNFDKIVEFGDKILAMDPNHLEAQLTLASMIPERLPTDDSAKKAALNKAKDLAMKATSQVQNLAKPANITEDQWKAQIGQIEATLHSALGMVHLNLLEYGPAIMAYEETLKRSPKDALAYFRLGLSFQGRSRGAFQDYEAAVKSENDAKTAKAEQTVLDELVKKREGLEAEVKLVQDRAMDSFAKAVALGGIVAQPAREQLERLFKAKNNDSLEGLEDFIAKAKSTLPG